MTGMKVLVCGDRHWTDRESIQRELESIDGISVVVHGAAKGADSIAADIAHEMELGVDSYPAQWGRYGRGAGPIRNQQMLDEGRPDLVLAFHRNLSSSKGTKDMVTRAKKAGIKVRVIGG